MHFLFFLQFFCFSLRAIKELGLFGGAVEHQGSTCSLFFTWTQKSRVMSRVRGWCASKVWCVGMSLPISNISSKYKLISI